jgi:hypothetical protein
MKSLYLLVYASICLTCFSCKKWIEVAAPVKSVTGDNAFKSDVNAIAAVTGLYTYMQTSSGSVLGSNGISFLSGLSADELGLDPALSSPDLLYLHYTNNLDVNVQFNTGLGIWQDLYNFIYRCNTILEGLNASQTLSISVKQQLLGEAYFIRAFSYFYLVNLYGNVPLLLTSDYEKNKLASRSDSQLVWGQITEDLKHAQSLLSVQYLDKTLLRPTIDRVRPVKGAATALLARVYLYMQQWGPAEAEATRLIDNAALYTLDSLNGVFLKNSHEAIWQLQPVEAGFNTVEARYFIIPRTGLSGFGGNAVYLSDFLLNAFENGDERRMKWVDSVITPMGVTYHYPYKYKSATYGDPVTEYKMMLRLGEQYLIRAEARARQNDLTGAINDLDNIRARSGLTLLQNTSAGISQESLIDTLIHERQVELFAEMGQRWLDLKRTAEVDKVMKVVAPLKSNGSVWQSFQQWYPIPLGEIQKDPNLQQTDGY